MQNYGDTNPSLTHIPGDVGIPLIGIMPRLMSDFHQSLYNLHEKYGDVSRTHIALQEGVLVLGPEECQHVLLDPERIFSARLGYQKSSSEWFGQALLLRDFDDHRVQRRLFQSAFKSKAMAGYAAIANTVIEQSILEWKTNDRILFVPLIQQLLIEIGLRAFYGVNPDDRSAKNLIKAFSAVLTKGMMSVAKINMPPFKYYYGKKGKRFIDSFFKSMIPSKRFGETDDLFTHLVNEKNDSGDYFSDRDIVDNSALLFFASYDTTTTALSHLVMHLADDPVLQDQIRQECLAIGSPVLSYEELAKLPQLENALFEALRLYPSAPVLMRKSIRECVLGQYPIPAGTMLFICPGFNQRDRRMWSNPELFDPDRFAREEHKRHPFSYLPFGGGAHKCIGMHFAIQNAKLFMYQLLLRYDVALRKNYRIHSDTLPVPRPSKNLPVTLMPR